MKKLILMAMAIVASVASQAQNAQKIPYIKDAALKAKYEAFQKSIEAPNEQLQQLTDEFKALQGDRSDEAETKRKDIVQEYDAVNERIEKMRRDFIRDNRDNELPAYLVGDVYSYSYEELKELLDPSTGYYNHPLMDRAKAQLASLEKRQPGRKFAELEMNDMEGKAVKLSDYVGKGKYVLVDFWASWCGPCRQEMPMVVKSYAQYKDKGYEIVGVSFDQNGEPWKKAVGDLGMTWPQMSDLKGWECQAHEAYGVNSIPSNVLVDPQGIIMAHDLRGQGLLEKLAEIFE